MIFDFKNGCKNEFKDNNEKSCSWSRNRVSLTIDFKVQWLRKSCGDSVGVNQLMKKWPDSPFHAKAIRPLNYRKRMNHLFSEKRLNGLPLVYQKFKFSFSKSRYSVIYFGLQKIISTVFFFFKSSYFLLILNRNFSSTKITFVLELRSLSRHARRWSTSPKPFPKNFNFKNISWIEFFGIICIFFKIKKADKILTKTDEVIGPLDVYFF